MSESEGEPIHVSRDDNIGSPLLAEALRIGDGDEIGRAVRLEVVIVPIIRTAEHDVQIRVFQPQTPDFPKNRYRLALFSSTRTLIEFLAGDEAREFDLRSGADLALFIREHRGALHDVVLDPAGPYPVAASIDAFLAALAPGDDDLAAWVAAPF